MSVGRRSAAQIILYFHAIGRFPQRKPSGIQRASPLTGTLLRSCPIRDKEPRGGTEMATASEPHTTDQAISDIEFEELLQRTWEMVQNQKCTHPLDQSAESTSWS